MIQQHQKGLTLIELIITGLLMTLLISMGFFVQQNLAESWQIAEDEAIMQRYSRTGIQRIKQELRQAKDIYVEPPSQALGGGGQGGVQYSFDIQFTIPDTDSNGAFTDTYNLVRYWYEEDATTKIWSLKRASKTNGASSSVPAGAPHFLDNSTYLIREAAVIEPGKQSYFKQDPDNPVLLHIHLVTATYVIKENGQGVFDMRRTFRVETEVEARNLSD